jgi:hypothetical protein
MVYLAVIIGWENSQLLNAIDRAFEFRRGRPRQPGTS